MLLWLRDTSTLIQQPPEIIWVTSTVSLLQQQIALL
jgi:hypothetical protein